MRETTKEEVKTTRLSFWASLCMIVIATFLGISYFVTEQWLVGLIWCIAAVIWCRTSNMSYQTYMATKTRYEKQVYSDPDDFSLWNDIKGIIKKIFIKLFCDGK